eukprot:scaffold4391_cov120-Isochrysis_galbana.AAC.1
MSDADNGQRLGAILARLRAVAASTSAQQGRYPAGELTAEAAPSSPTDTREALSGHSMRPHPDNRHGGSKPAGWQEACRFGRRQEKKKLRERVEANDGAPTAPAGAGGGGYGRGKRLELEASPR